MFMVASAYGLARLHSCHLYFTPVIIDEINAVFIFDFSSLLISTAKFNSIINSTAKTLNRIIKSVGCQYILELTRPNAISPGNIFELQGYWQSYLHFLKYSDELRNHIFVARQPIIEKVSKLFIDIYQQQFKFSPHFSFDNQQLFKKQLVQSNWTTWIGIHIRRSDFLESFSVGDDLTALSLCEHSIITGGTFGWWAAYLANGQVIHDKVYPSGCGRREYYYPSWFMIDGYVRAYKNSNNTLR
ncbi:unnamed protein product [Rotaria socialis]